MKTMINEFSRLFDYRNGVLVWKERPLSDFKNQRGCSIWNSQNVGKVAGTKRANGYLAISINKKFYLAHRVVFAMHHGFLPEEVDHINGVKDDNRIENLRAATVTDNRRNAVSKAGRSGVKGVDFVKRDNAWRVRVSSMQIGYFRTLDDAKCAALKAREVIHGAFANHKVYFGGDSHPVAEYTEVEDDEGTDAPVS